MNILDSKGRLFGKINLLDLGAVLVILLVIVGIFSFLFYIYIYLIVLAAMFGLVWGRYSLSLL